MVKNITLLLRMMKIFDNYMMIRATKILNYILSKELYDTKLYFSTAAFKHLVLTIVWKPPLSLFPFTPHAAKTFVFLQCREGKCTLTRQQNLKVLNLVLSLHLWWPLSPEGRWFYKYSQVSSNHYRVLVSELSSHEQKKLQGYHPW